MKKHVSLSYEQRMAKSLAEEQALLKTLECDGFSLSSLQDCINGRISTELGKSLLKLLPKAEMHKETIIRALKDRNARGYASAPLIDIFLKTKVQPKSKRQTFLDPDGTRHEYAGEGESLKWVIGLSLSTNATAEDADALIRICLNKKHGTSRQEIVSCLHRFKTNPAVIPTLLELLDQDDVAAHALEALRRINTEEARPKAEALLDHSRPLIRKGAKKLLEKLDA